jgi:predicted DNA-binding transcriptional regulator AlpA
VADRHSDMARKRNAHGASRNGQHRLPRSNSDAPRTMGHETRSTSLLTIAEVLTELQVARSTFDTWRSLGTAPECIKLPNGQIRIRRCALDSWLTAHSDREAS